MVIIDLERKLTAEINKLFNSNYSNAKIPYGREIPWNFFEKRIFDSSLYLTDCSKVAISSSGDICGLAIANRKQHPNSADSNYIYLNLLVAMHDVRKIETGQKLIAALLLEAVNSEKKGVVTSLQWGGIWPGIMSHSKEQIDLFSKTGAEFRTGEIFIELDIRQTTGMSFTEKAFHKLFGVTIRHYENTDFESLHHLLSKEFGVGWTHEVLNKVNKDFECFNGYGLASPYNPNDVFVVSNKNEIFGFCIVQSGTGTKQGFFGPVGLVQNMRGKGIGSLLFIEAVNYLKSKGKEQIGLWTNETIYSSFYKKIGCYKTFETLHAEWSV